MKQKELDAIVEANSLYVRGKGGERANLRGATLEGASLKRADLREANLEGANLWGANLWQANLGGTNLRGSHLERANLEGANLEGVYLEWANLWQANLGGTNLRGAHLERANLEGASLEGAYLNWMSHNLIAEILRQAAGDSVRRRMIAGLVTVSTDWCWEDFLRIRHKERKWALETLASYVQEGDFTPKTLKWMKGELKEPDGQHGK